MIEIQERGTPRIIDAEITVNGCEVKMDIRKQPDYMVLRKAKFPAKEQDGSYAIYRDEETGVIVSSSSTPEIVYDREMEPPFRILYIEGDLGYKVARKNCETPEKAVKLRDTIEEVLERCNEYLYEWGFEE